MIDVWERINSDFFFCLFLLMNSLQVTCDFPRFADYSKLFTDDLANILGLSVTCKESVSRIMSESRDSSKDQELVWRPGELRGIVHLQLTLVTSLNASGLPTPHLSWTVPSIARITLMIIVKLCMSARCFRANVSVGPRWKYPEPLIQRSDIIKVVLLVGWETYHRVSGTISKFKCKFLEIVH